METLEDFAKNYSSINYSNHTYDAVLAGAKWQEKRMCNYNDEDMYLYAIYYKNSLINTPLNILTPQKWFEQFKKQ
jgi:hypothetical protein